MHFFLNTCSRIKKPIADLVSEAEANILAPLALCQGRERVPGDPQHACTTAKPSLQNRRELIRKRDDKRQKFAYETMIDGGFARFARAFSIFVHSIAVLVLSTTCNDLFCRCVDDVST